MKRLCYLGILKDKRVITNFRYLNIRIARNSLVYPLLKDTFPVLGSSRCEVLSVLHLNDVFHSLRLLENSKNIVGFCHILEVLHICIKECLWD